MMLRLVALLQCAACISAQVVSFGSCNTNVKTQASFDLQKYLGDWFEVYRYPAVFEYDSKCTEATYSLKPDGHVKVYNRGIRSDGSKTEATGDAYQEDPQHDPAKLKVHFAAGTPYGNYWVLDTDYTGYSLIYSCSNFAGIIHTEFAWILARDRTLNQTIVDELTETLSNYGSKTDKFIKTDQKGCQ